MHIVPQRIRIDCILFVCTLNIELLTNCEGDHQLKRYIDQD